MIVLLFFFPNVLLSQPILSPEDAVRLGLQNNFDIQIARNEARIAANDIGKGTAGYLPTLDATGSYGVSTTDVETNSPFSFGKSDTRSAGGEVSLGWTIFDGFGIYADRKRYQELARLGEVRARNIIENTVVDILRAYYDLVQKELLLEVDRNALQISETRLSKEQVRRDLGGASSTDLLNAQVSYNNDKAALLNQELELLIARKELNILLGRDPSTPLEVVKEIAIPPLDRTNDDLLKIAEERNSEVLVARQNKRVADQDVRLAQSAFFPKLSLGANYGYTDVLVSSSSETFPEDINTRSTDRFVGLSLSYNLFNGGRDRIELQRARIEARNLELALADTRNRLAGLVREKYETYLKRIELMELEEQNVLAARQNLDLNTDRYRIGAARFQSRIARLEIEQLIGEIDIR
jgi:outer membrane protein TolC